MKESHFVDYGDALKNVAERHRIFVKELGIMPNYVYMVVFLPPEISVSKAINLLKGASSYELFKLRTNSIAISEKAFLVNGALLQIGQRC